MEQNTTPASFVARLGAVWASIGDALRFAVENWRFVLSAAAIGASVNTLALASFGANLLWFIAVLLASGALHAAFTRAALSGPDRVRATLGADVARVIGAMAIVSVFVAIVLIVVVYVAMSVLIAPYIEQVKAAGEDQSAVAALLQRAAEAQPGVVRWAGAIGGLIVFALTSRFYFAAPASVESGRVLAFQSWAQTRGNMLRIMLGRLVLLGPALVFVLALSMSAAEFARSQGAVVALAVIWASAFVQMAVHSSLEAGLSVGLYRRLSATAAAKA